MTWLSMKERISRKLVEGPGYVVQTGFLMSQSAGLLGPETWLCTQSSKCILTKTHFSRTNFQNLVWVNIEVSIYQPFWVLSEEDRGLSIQYLPLLFLFFHALFSSVRSSDSSLPPLPILPTPFRILTHCISQKSFGSVHSAWTFSWSPFQFNPSSSLQRCLGL